MKETRFRRQACYAHRSPNRPSSHSGFLSRASSPEHWHQNAISGMRRSSQSLDQPAGAIKALAFEEISPGSARTHDSPSEIDDLEAGNCKKWKYSRFIWLTLSCVLPYSSSASQRFTRQLVCNPGCRPRDFVQAVQKTEVTCKSSLSFCLIARPSGFQVSIWQCLRGQSVMHLLRRRLVSNR